MAPPGRLQLADILSTYGQDYLAAHALARSQAKAWRAIVSCRTAALGGHVDRCNACGTTRHVYHSCRNRHCPRCQTRAKEQWIAGRRGFLFPVKALSKVFRGKFIDGLAQAREQGRLQRGMPGGVVAFRVRDNARSGKKRIVRLPAQQFIGRFLQHVLPPAAAGCRRGWHACRHMYHTRETARQRPFSLPRPHQPGLQFP